MVDWTPLGGSVASASLSGWTVDAATYPSGSSMRVSAIARLGLGTDAASPVDPYPVQICLRLATVAGGPIPESTVCADQTMTPDAFDGEVVYGDLHATFALYRLTGPSVPLANGDVYLETSYSGAPLVVLGVYPATPEASASPVYLEVVPS